jgi:hypothetical protein
MSSPANALAGGTSTACLARSVGALGVAAIVLRSQHGGRETAGTSLGARSWAQQQLSAARCIHGQKTYLLPARSTDATALTSERIATARFRYAFTVR